MDIYIPIPDNISDENNTPLFVSLMQSSDTLYSAFLKPKLKATDYPVVSANGFLYFDKSRNQYKVSSMDKLRQFNLPGNYISLDRENCFTYSEGKINLSTGLGRVVFDVYGNVENMMNSGKTDIDAFIILDFFFSDNALKIFSENLEKYNDLQAVDISRESYGKSLSEVIGIETADKFISDLNLVGRVRGRFPDALEKTFVFNHVHLKWNNETRSYQSVGKIGIGNMQKNLINKYVDGYIELIQRRGGDVLNVYLELDKGDWYFFSYQNRVMQAWSSHKEFMQIITEVKPQNRRLKTDKGEQPYSYYLSSERRVKEFLKKFQEEEKDEDVNTDDEEEKEEKEEN